MDVITCIKNVDNTKTFRIHSNYNNNVLEIKILHDGHSYICKVTRDISKKFAQTFEIDSNQYEEKLVNYLSNNCLDVRVDIVKGEFIVFKNKIKYFHCVPEVIDYSTTVCLLLDDLTKKNVSLSEKLVLLEDEKEKIIEEKDTYKSKLEEYVKENTIREEKLYSCFVQLLNEKKQRIQFLTEMLDAGHGKKTEGSPKRKKVESKKNKRNNISDSESNVDSDVESYKTDDEAECNNDEAKPGTSKDLSLLDDDDDDGPALNILPQRVNRGNAPSGVKSSISISQSERSQVVKDKEDHVFVENTPNVQYSTQDMIDSI